jgi:ArsR family transcriptional regulator, arsenate/arsenite/antimonite-responsive transcriptional repressor
MKATEVVPALAALAQENRLDVFRLLVQAGPDGLPAGHIAEKLDIPSPTLSFHLAQLKHAGLVQVRRDGRSLIYAADFRRMNSLIGYLTENCCGGDPVKQAIACAPAQMPKVRRRQAAGRA